jgi:uncharacterized metal-binding protein
VNRQYSQCANCGFPDKERICRTEKGRGPRFCPTLEKKEIVARAMEILSDPSIMEFARNASIQEAECFVNRDKKPYVKQPAKPRLEEIIEFARKMNYKKLGLVFCMGLRREARVTARILESSGFEVVSVGCKVGGIHKERIGVKDNEKINIGCEETMCNPIAQAAVVNDAGTDFNVLLGLCVGHDSLFFKHAESPTTVFAVKDRVLGHNPLGVVYTAESYYPRFLSKIS